MLLTVSVVSPSWLTSSYYAGQSITKSHNDSLIVRSNPGNELSELWMSNEVKTCRSEFAPCQMPKNLRYHKTAGHQTLAREDLISHLCEGGNVLHFFRISTKTSRNCPVLISAAL